MDTDVSGRGLDAISGGEQLGLVHSLPSQKQSKKCINLGKRFVVQIQKISREVPGRGGRGQTMKGGRDDEALKGPPKGKPEGELLGGISLQLKKEGERKNLGRTKGSVKKSSLILGDRKVRKGHC